MQKKRISTAILLIFTILFVFAGCGGADDNNPSADAGSGAESSGYADLSGKSLFVYCGAGMKDPMTEIVDVFKEKTYCDADITFGNAAQIISQITTSQEGDVFIAGAETELAKLKEQDYVTESKQLVKHVPVIAVQKGNPKGIASIADLGKEGVTLVLGDSEATPIGKVADNVLQDAGITDSADIIARTSTAPEMVTALFACETDAAVVWKENASGKDGIDIAECKDMEQYIKVIPAASLSCAKNNDSLKEFLAFLDSEEAQKIWGNYGYEIIK